MSFRTVGESIVSNLECRRTTARLTLELHLSRWILTAQILNNHPIIRQEPSVCATTVEVNEWELWRQSLFVSSAGFSYDGYHTTTHRVFITTSLLQTRSFSSRIKLIQFINKDELSGGLPLPGKCVPRKHFVSICLQPMVTPCLTTWLLPLFDKSCNRINEEAPAEALPWWRLLAIWNLDLQLYRVMKSKY